MMRTASIKLETNVEQAARLAALRSAYADACNPAGSHRFVCENCGLRAHSDLNASRHLARIGSGAPLSRAAVNTPDVGGVEMGNHVYISQ